MSLMALVAAIRPKS